MGKTKELGRVINAISKIGKEAEEIRLDLEGILEKAKNPGPSKELVQRLLGLRDEITSSLKPLNQIRETAIRERIEVEKKSPPSL